MDKKTCTKCGKEKSIYKDFRVKKSQCKACEALYLEEWRADNPEKVKQQNKRCRENRSIKENKTCFKCGIHIDKCSYCVSCYNKYRAEYYRNNKEQLKINQEKWNNRNKEKVVSARRIYRKGTLEKDRVYMSGLRKKNAIKKLADSLGVKLSEVPQELIELRQALFDLNGELIKIFRKGAKNERTRN